ncbi:periplasmic trehalase [Escherichia coli]|uniref:Periplasmic trehalase n=1 Tax=Escherichia coli TaxID=562 RepID=A0A377D0W2_ECOLX|nr:periplasmic trehalase [Escherichia coli]
MEDIATAKSNPNRPATEIYRDLRSAAASGWDFSSRWMDNPQQLNTLRTTSIVPVDLNSLMFKMEKILARASKAAGDNAMANQYETLANARQKGIEKYLWNDQQGWYADYDLKSHKGAQSVNRGRPVPAVRQCGSERSRQQNGDGDENTSAATRRPEHYVGEKWATMGCAKWLGTVTVGRDRRITKTTGKKRWRWTLAGTS